MRGLLAKYPNGFNDFAFAANKAISVGGFPGITSEAEQVAPGTLDGGKDIPAGSLGNAKTGLVV